MVYPEDIFRGHKKKIKSTSLSLQLIHSCKMHMHKQSHTVTLSFRIFSIFFVECCKNEMLQKEEENNICMEIYDVLNFISMFIVAGSSFLLILCFYVHAGTGWMIGRFGDLPHSFSCLRKFNEIIVQASLNDNDSDDEVSIEDVCFYKIVKKFRSFNLVPSTKKALLNIT